MCTAAYSHDGKFFYFVSQSAFGFSILKYAVDGSSGGTIIAEDGRGSVFAPAESPNGVVLAYNLGPRRNNDNQIVVSNINGSNPRAITASEGVGYSDNSPAFSPSSANITFEASNVQATPYAIATINSNGAGLRYLVTSAVLGGSSRDPFYLSEDRIIFASNSDGDFDLYSIRTNGSSLTKILDRAGDQRGPVSNNFSFEIYQDPDANLLSGESGDDRLHGASGADALDGGSGSDTLTGGAGADTLDAGAIGSPSGDDWLDGGVGADFLSALDGGADTLLGGDGDDTITTLNLTPRSEVNAGAGNDLIVLKGSSGTLVTLGPGRDTVALSVSGTAPLSVYLATFTDFTPGAEGDILDLRALTSFFRAWVPGMDLFAEGGIRVIQSGLDSVLQADFLGLGSGFTNIATFVNTVASNFVGANFLTLVTSGTANNTAPVAAIDAYIASEDQPLVVDRRQGLLINDTDAQGDSLSARLVSEPLHGVLTLNTDGSFTYRSNADYVGADSFTYQANDGLASSSTVSVNINVRPVNDAPTVVSDSIFTLIEGSRDPLYRPVAVDPDGPTTLNWAIGGPDGALFQIDQLTGILAFKVAPSHSSPTDHDRDGVYEVVISASDGAAVTAKVLSFVVTPNSDALSITGTSLADTLTGGGGADTIYGGDGDDFLVSGGGNDSLLGGAGADTLTSNSSAATLDGGAGNDLYLLHHPSDLVLEGPGGGADTIITAVNITQPDHVETLQIAAGISGITITGGVGNDMLIGNGLSNDFNGGAGDDVILAGNVTLADIHALFNI